MLSGISRAGLRFKSAPPPAKVAPAVAPSKPVKPVLSAAEAKATRLQLAQSLARNVVRRLAARPATMHSRAAPAEKQAMLEKALLDFNKALPPGLERVNSSIAEFSDETSRDGEDNDKQPFLATPEYQRYQKTAQLGSDAHPLQAGDIVFGLEGLVAPRWDRRDVLLHPDSSTGELLDRMGLTCISRLQVPTFFDLSSSAIHAHADALKRHFVDWTDPSDAHILRFETRLYFSHEDDPKTAETKVSMRVRVADLPVSPAAQVYVRVLANKRYSPVADQLKLTCNWHTDMELNKQHIKNQLAVLMLESRKLAEEDAAAAPPPPPPPTKNQQIA